LSADAERYIAVSAKIETEDLDWAAARRVGLTADEQFVLTYFSDIESQTIRYLRTLLHMKIAFQPKISAFLTTWSYEEFFHGHALARLMAECGHQLEEDRVERVGAKARFNEWMEGAFTPILSRVFSRHFPAVYMSFGAIQELTTLRGYERLSSSTSNPVLKTLCDRIAKQERRHFAWYFNHARQYLDHSRFTQVLARRLLEFDWAPVGAGVKTEAEVRRLFSILFPGEHGRRLVREIDTKIGTLPGLDGVVLMRSYFKEGQPTTRAILPGAQQANEC
jgi:rubrerythrin